MHRVKNVQFDKDELYSDNDDDEYDYEGSRSGYDEDHLGADPPVQGDAAEEDAYTPEDRENFAALTPVVRAELDEASADTAAAPSAGGVDVSDGEIREALWYYYWDLEKSVAYLRNKMGRGGGGKTEKTKKEKQKHKSKFDLAAEKSSVVAAAEPGIPVPSLPACQDWFKGVPWINVPSALEGHLVSVGTSSYRPKLLGGSSKLAKLAEERRKKAATASAAAVTSQSLGNTPSAALSSLDRLSKPRTEEERENKLPRTKPESKKYPIRKKKEPSPPPREPSPPVEEVQEPLPDLRATPSEFAQTTASTKSGRSANEVTKKTEALKLDSTRSNPPTQPKVKSKGLDVPKLWADELSKRKPSTAFVVIGHVDHGKSTLMGRLLLDSGAVAQRDVDRFKKQAAELGKSSFALAWVMDTGSDERERGVTVDIAQHHFATNTSDFTILDAPGHRDFVPNMISGASMADIAVLVVDANQIDSGMKGQTREHVLLAKACGLERIIVAVNKLDSTKPPWDEGVFNRTKGDTAKLLAQAGFMQDNITFVPCSGLTGQNVVKPADSESSAKWVTESSGSLLQELESCSADTTSETSVKEPFRMQIADVFRGGIMNPLSISGRLAAGNLQIGDTVLVQPSAESASVKGIEAAGEASEWAVAGQLCSVHLADIEAQHLRVGDVLCSAKSPVTVARTFSVRVEAIDALLPQGIDVHVGRLHVAGNIARLVAIFDDRGEMVRKRPRVVEAGRRALVKVQLDSGAPMAVGERIVLRSNGDTIAAGRVESVSA